MSNDTAVQLLEEKLRLLEQERELRLNLPHLHLHKKYKWQNDFIITFQKIMFICAANQCGKSYCNIVKCIIMATSKERWSEWWDTERIGVPNLFWYLYPDQAAINREFRTKWKKYLPKGVMKDDSYYGWTDLKEGQDTIGISFNSGVVVEFKSYSQDVTNLQTATLYACFTKGHKILTNKGDVNIEEIEIGDLVLTRSGYNKVKNTITRESEIYEVKFSNGTLLKGTGDHPVFTIQRGWVKIQDLTVTDCCVTIPEWTKILNHIGNLLYSKAICFGETVYQKITGLKIILRLLMESSSISKYGKNIIKKMFPKVFVSIIKTLIHSTIEFVISNWFQGQNIPGYIKNKNGKPKKSILAFVLSAVTNLNQEVQKNTYHNIVQKNVDVWQLIKGKKKELFKLCLLKFVSFAEKSLNLCINQTLFPVLKPVQVKLLGTKEKVYNLTVSNTPEYFCNNILVHNCFIDEEPRFSYYPELKSRTTATKGYMFMVFTATKGQEEWACAIEERGDKETFKDAYKRQITLYDCMFYEDGSSGMFNERDIRQIINEYPTEGEIMKRVFGRFVSPEGVIYQGFSSRLNVCAPYDITGWSIYAAIDYGKGAHNHKSAIAFLAVRPDRRKGAIFRGWKGDDKTYTDEGYVVDKYIVLRQGLNIKVAWYDHSAKDLFDVAALKKVYFAKANKAVELGQGKLNTLFKNQMLDIFDIAELRPGISQLLRTRHSQAKNRRDDDFLDVFRFLVVNIPWDFSGISSDEIIKITKDKRELATDRMRNGIQPELSQDIESELKEWAEAYEL